MDLDNYLSQGLVYLSAAFLEHIRTQVINVLKELSLIPMALTISENHSRLFQHELMHGTAKAPPFPQATFRSGHVYGKLKTTD